MSHGTIIVTTQYYDENGKPKSMQEFRISLKSDMIDVSTYADCADAIVNMLKEYDKNSPCRHEYRSHKISFFDPIELDGEKFDQELETILRGEA